MMKLILAALIIALLAWGLLLWFILWDSHPEEKPAAAPAPTYREDTAHYLTEDGELMRWEE